MIRFQSLNISYISSYYLCYSNRLWIVYSQSLQPETTREYEVLSSPGRFRAWEKVTTGSIPEATRMENKNDKRAMEIVLNKQIQFRCFN